jgi:hypothetical protein
VIAVDPSETLALSHPPSLDVDSLLSSDDSSFMERRAADSAWGSCPDDVSQDTGTDLKGLVASSPDKSPEHHLHFHKSSRNRKRGDVRSAGGKALACRTSFLI